MLNTPIQKQIWTHMATWNNMAGCIWPTGPRFDICAPYSMLPSFMYFFFFYFSQQVGRTFFFFLTIYYFCTKAFREFHKSLFHCPDLVTSYHDDMVKAVAPQHVLFWLTTGSNMSVTRSRANKLMEITGPAAKCLCVPVEKGFLTSTHLQFIKA